MFSNGGRLLGDPRNDSDHIKIVLDGIVML